MPFNSTRYDNSQGSLSEGFQGRPDAAVYRRGLKESQNFLSGSDGAARFRKGFERDIVSAPLSDLDDTTTGIVKTLPFYIPAGFIGAAFWAGGWAYLDMCLDKSTGKYTTVYGRVGDSGHLVLSIEGDVAYVEPVVSSSTAGGEITLATALLPELYREGSFVNVNTVADGRIPAIISQATDAARKVFTVVQEDGQAFTALNPVIIMEVMGNVLTNPIEPNFDWVAADNSLYIVDGANTYKFFMQSTGGSFFIDENPTLTNSPFPSGDFPTVVGYYESRIIYSGFVTDPTLVAFSRAPTGDGLNKKEDFTTGTLATDAITIYLNPSSLTPVSEIKWVKGSSRALLIGLDTGVAEVTSQGVALAPDDVDVSLFSFKDPSAVKPLAFDNFVNWVSVDGDKIYESSFAFDFDADVSYNVSVLTDIRARIVNMISFTGKEEGMVALQEDGDILLGIRSSERGISFFPMAIFLGNTISPGDLIKHIFSYTSADGQVVGMNVATADGKYKILKVNIEAFLRYDFIYLKPDMFPFVSDTNDIVTTYANGIKFNMLDDSFSHSVLLSDTTDSITFSDSDDEDYDIIVSTNDAITSNPYLVPELGIAFELAQSISATSFYANYLFEGLELDADVLPITLSGSRLDRIFEQFTEFNITTNGLIDSDALVIADGSVVEVTPSQAVGDYGYYTVTLDSPAFFSHIGHSYSGMFTMVPLSSSGSGQLGVNRKKSIAEIMFRLLNTGGGKAWVNRIAAEDFDFKDPGVYNWKPYINDTYTVRPQSSWEGKTEITFFQKEPQPLNISLIDVYEEVSRE